MLENRLNKGDKVPDFKCIDDNGKSVEKKDLEGKKWIIFFYPKADTPGCTAEACNITDNHKKLLDKGYTIVGASADSTDSQKKFKTKYNLSFPLLADENKEVINAFGVWGAKKFMGKSFNGIHRITFIINKEGVVDHVIDKVKTKDHAAQILALVTD